MAYVVHRPGWQLPMAAASTVPARTVVKLGASSPLRVLAAASVNDRPFGMIGDATAVSEQIAPIYEEGNIVKAISAASLGAGAEVAVASIGIATAAQGGPSFIATTTLLGPLSVASGTKKWAVGIALDAVDAGQVFSLYIKPRLTGQTLDS